MGLLGFCVQRYTKSPQTGNLPLIQPKERVQEERSQTCDQLGSPQ